ncbi:MAG: 16S rRNA (cytosine(1402)-N(4))-methyltransferase, partial [Gemmatimonadetes bacterium]|nr:16S rRNA (cytosine(1402)-N(4))-methyltransferase [Gemmatimonadota bacterium]
RYGEEKRSRKLARIVLEMREREPFATSDQLLDAIGRTLGPRAEAADKARIFQALRIAVNGEIQALERALESFRQALAPGGVFAVLAYHSLEDRLVKNAFRDWSLDCVCPPGFPQCQCRGKPLGTTITRKPMSATEQETLANPRARSARLRGWRAA